MKSMKKVLLGAALAVGALAMTAAPAQAARLGVYVGVGAPAAYIPPSPGPGYVWINGYWAGGVWVPGYWNYPRVEPRAGFGIRIGGPVPPYYGGPVYHGYDHFRR